MLRFWKILLSLLLSLVIFSCQKNFERPNWDVKLLAPLVKSTLGLSNLLPDSVIQTNPDTSLKLVYQTNIFDIDMDSIFKIPDTTIANIFSVPLSSIANPGSAFYSQNQEIRLNISNGVALNYALISSGFINIEIFSEIKEKVIVEYTMPSATKNGDTLVLRELIPAATNTQSGYFTKMVDISGYQLDLTGTSKTKVNTLVTRAVGSIDSNATGPVLIMAGTKITINNSLINIVPAYVRGYFGSQQIHFGPDTTNFNVFNKIIAGTLDLNEVNVNLVFENGIGVDAQLTVNQFKTINTTNNTTANLSGSIIGTSNNINRAQETFSTPEVTYSNYTTSINTLNSNIDQLIEIFPNKLIYDIDLQINPYGNLSGSHDFVFRKYPLKTHLNVEIPLSLIATNLTLVDTTDINISQTTTNGKIIAGDLIVLADNGYPFDATITLILLDGNNNYLSTISSLNKIEAAPLNASLRVINKKSSRLVYQVSSNDINNLYAAKKVVVKIAFTTAAQPQFIKIYEEYHIDIKLVGDFSYNVNLN